MARKPLNGLHFVSAETAGLLKSTAYASEIDFGRLDVREHLSDLVSLAPSPPLIEFMAVVDFGEIPVTQLRSKAPLLLRFRPDVVTAAD